MYIGELSLCLLYKNYLGRKKHEWIASFREVQQVGWILSLDYLFRATGCLLVIMAANSKASTYMWLSVHQETELPCEPGLSKVIGQEMT